MILIYKSTSCSVQKDMGLLVGIFKLNPLQPFCSHFCVRNLLSLAIVAVIGFLPVFLWYSCNGFFFITVQHLFEISNGDSNINLYFSCEKLLFSSLVGFSFIGFSLSVVSIPIIIASLRLLPPAFDFIRLFSKFASFSDSMMLFIVPPLIAFRCSSKIKPVLEGASENLLYFPVPVIFS